MNSIYIDIETIPGDNKVDINKISAPSNYKKEEAIEKYKDEKAQDLYLKQSLIPYKGEICCIGIGINNNEVEVFSNVFGQEALITSMFDYIKGVIPEGKDLVVCEWIGYNIKSFDLWWLFLNTIKYDIANEYILPKDKYSNRIIDLMEVVSYKLYGQYVSFDDIYKYFFDKPAKTNMDGSMVAKYYEEGRLDDIIMYCKQDVENTRELANLFNY